MIIWRKGVTYTCSFAYCPPARHFRCWGEAFLANIKNCEETLNKGYLDLLSKQSNDQVLSRDQNFIESLKFESNKMY
jgi:hypothetical protein